MTLKLASKAETLKQLHGRLNNANVKKPVSFTVGHWLREPNDCIRTIQTELDDEVVIVRSSAIAEDCSHQSLAGHFMSVPDVVRSSSEEISIAVNKVILSYEKDSSGASEDNLILVQGQLTSLDWIGVAFTADLSTLAPYYVINYDDKAPSCEAVTGGRKAGLKTFICFKGSLESVSDVRLKRLLLTLQELETLFQNDTLDVEFAFDIDGQLYILQVRAIVKKGKKRFVDELGLKEALRKTSLKLKKIATSHPYLNGSKTILAVMPDWNPAEIIGIRPRPLSLSLYKELVTDSIWASQRKNYGYKNVCGFPLIRSLMGLPYVDVRVTFNSFVPNDVSEELTRRLVDYYVDLLEKNPSAHDKVEFKIVLSCFHPMIEKKLSDLRGAGFSAEECDELRNALRNLTNRIMSPSAGYYLDDLRKVEELKIRQKTILNSELPALAKIYWLIEDCKNFGTLPFAGLARSAFVATQFFQTFIELGILTAKDYELFMRSSDLITREFSADCRRLKRNQITQTTFLEKYGHLRPGTYDIMSPRYDEAFEFFFSNIDPGTLDEPPPPFSLSNQAARDVDLVMQDSGLLCNHSELFTFMRTVISGRERSKFIFSKSLSDVLRILEGFGSRFEFSREDLSFIDIKTILSLYSNIVKNDIPDIFSRDIDFNRNNFRLTEALRLPQIIAGEQDLYSFFLDETEPNYISLGRASAKTITEERFERDDLVGRIALIRSADPGYDWIFSRGIAGLITMYGGANSHMAVRAAELGLPAVIGAGESNFLSWSRARKLEIDCPNQRVRVLT